jgi:hypothetical protein
MSNKHLEGEINKIDYKLSFITTALMVVSFVLGKYLVLNFWGIIFAFIIIVSFAVFGLFKYENLFEDRRNHEKGLDFELEVKQKLDKLGYFNDHSVQLENDGDLDFYVHKTLKDGASIFYGIEAKNWPGNVTFENNALIVNNFDNTDILTALLRRCAKVRDIKIGSDSKQFIKPVLVFGYKTNVKIPGNTIKISNVDVIVAAIQDLEKFI